MAFEIKVVVAGEVAEMELSGDLDRAAAERQFRPQLDRLVEVWKSEPPGEPVRLVLRMRDLAYIASGGCRVLIFAAQQIRSGLTVYLVAPREEVKEVLDQTGLSRSVVILDEYPPAHD
jgi:anti-anti-sigma factor